MKKPVLAAILLIGSLASCGEKREKIGDDAYLVDLSGRTSAIIDGEGNFLVFPNVEAASVHGNFVVGYRGRALDNSFDLDEYKTGFGYFVYDLPTREIRQGLTESECREDSVCKHYF